MKKDSLKKLELKIEKISDFSAKKITGGYQTVTTSCQNVCKNSFKICDSLDDNGCTVGVRCTDTTASQPIVTC